MSSSDLETHWDSTCHIGGRIIGTALSRNMLSYETIPNIRVLPDIMWLIGTFIYRDHHWMNTRDEMLFGLTCTFDC
jgi:hypothetical protein